MKCSIIQYIQNDPTFYSAAFDMQQVLSTPSATSTIFYKRKLSSYNLSMYSNGSGAGTCYLWDEVNGKRGANEIGTRLYIHINSLPTQHKPCISLFTHLWWTHRNKCIAATLVYIIQHAETITTIDHKFMESGHSQMEVDSIQEATETAKKSRPTAVYMPRDWHVAYKLARRKNE